ncbi:hypothetical protein ZIOFF_038283 [Zingiber officinale]|uniref:Tr-type G domain-containing protein n=1 Tax=Zingiber officinale TaxID=94328 RepID=A0A8J5KSI0_ZINOF|nr:hypothetical protein ZIOFF_038283 [Zingiber officinale]
MEDESRVEDLPHQPSVVDDGVTEDWSKEEDDPVAEDHPPSAAATDLADPQSEDTTAEIQTVIQSLQLETGVKDKKATTDEEAEELDDKEENKKRHLNVVFIGHVDAGKSTAGGQILLLSGQVDERAIQKYEKEAKDKNRDSWYMAYIMDTNEEERVKGITVEVGRAHFETENTRFTVLDAPRGSKRDGGYALEQGTIKEMATFTSEDSEEDEVEKQQKRWCYALKQRRMKEVVAAFTRCCVRTEVGSSLVLRFGESERGSVLPIFPYQRVLPEDHLSSSLAKFLSQFAIAFPWNFWVDEVDILLGHKSYVPNMISGASQADVGVLVISARKGEFETGYEKGGQTREHVQLAKTLGVSKLVIVVNKMDDPTVRWSKERFDEIESKMVPFLKSSGYNVKKVYQLSGLCNPKSESFSIPVVLEQDINPIDIKDWLDVQFLPISALLGANMKIRMEKSICDWWSGPCLFEVLDAIEIPPRDPKGPVRMPIIDKYKDMGTVVMGKLESGSINEGDNLFVMPNKASVKVLSIICDEKKVRRAGPGENVKVKLAGVEEEDILAGFVLSSVAKPIGAFYEFNAQLQILELLDNAIFTAGYKAVLHIHSIVEECEVIDLLEEIDTKRRKEEDPRKKAKAKRKPLFVKNGAVVVCRIQVTNLICIENFSDFAQLGRFTLRTEGKTVAVGKVVALPPAGSVTFA